VRTSIHIFMRAAVWPTPKPFPLLHKVTLVVGEAEMQTTRKSHYRRRPPALSSRNARESTALRAHLYTTVATLFCGLKFKWLELREKKFWGDKGRQLKVRIRILRDGFPQNQLMFTRTRLLLEKISLVKLMTSTLRF